MAQNNISSKCIGLCLALSVCLTAPANGLQLMKMRVIQVGWSAQARVDRLNSGDFAGQKDIIVTTPNFPEDSTDRLVAQNIWYQQHSIAPGEESIIIQTAMLAANGLISRADCPADQEAALWPATQARARAWIAQHPLLTKTEILPNLWLGQVGMAYPADFLDDLYFFPMTRAENFSEELRAIPDMGDTPRQFKLRPEEGDVGIEDMQAGNMARFNQALRMMNILLFQKGKKVFVGCQQGRDRSAALVVAFVAAKYNITVIEAEKFVRTQRPVVTVNTTGDHGAIASYWDGFLNSEAFFSAPGNIEQLHNQFNADFASYNHADLPKMITDLEGDAAAASAGSDGDADIDSDSDDDALALAVDAAVDLMFSGGSIRYWMRGFKVANVVRNVEHTEITGYRLKKDGEDSVMKKDGAPVEYSPDDVRASAGVPLSDLNIGDKFHTAANADDDSCSHTAATATLTIVRGPYDDATKDSQEKYFVVHEKGDRVEKEASVSLKTETELKALLRAPAGDDAEHTKVEGEDADAEDADSNRDNVDTEEGGCMACCRSN